MKQLIRNLPRGAVLSAAALALTTLLFLFVLTRSDDDVNQGPSGLSNQPTKALADVDQSSGIGTCLTPGVSGREKNDLVARLEEAGRNDGYADTSVAAIEISLQDAESIVDLDTLAPEAPTGWTRTVYLRSTEKIPLEQCWVETIVRDPSVSVTTTVPEERGFTHDGEPAVRPEYTYTIHKQAAVQISEGAPPLALDTSDSPELTYGWTEIQGQKALFSTRTYDEPSVTLAWDHGGMRIFMACSLMTFEECQSIAETVK